MWIVVVFFVIAVIVGYIVSEGDTEEGCAVFALIFGFGWVAFFFVSEGKIQKLLTDAKHTVYMMKPLSEDGSIGLDHDRFIILDENGKQESFSTINCEFVECDSITKQVKWASYESYWFNDTEREMVTIQIPRGTNIKIVNKQYNTTN